MQRGVGPALRELLRKLRHEPVEQSTQRRPRWWRHRLSCRQEHRGVPQKEGMQSSGCRCVPSLSAGAVGPSCRSKADTLEDVLHQSHHRRSASPRARSRRRPAARQVVAQGGRGHHLLLHQGEHGEPRGLVRSGTPHGTASGGRLQQQPRDRVQERSRGLPLQDEVQAHPQALRGRIPRSRRGNTDGSSAHDTGGRRLHQQCSQKAVKIRLAEPRLRDQERAQGRQRSGDNRRDIRQPAQDEFHNLLFRGRRARRRSAAGTGHRGSP
mmetsp:Transcript_30917/g.102994  ORF Transcript_30917/g.102994 Transcript_30917/m.102994 type:complete len:267 (+) Transcript_30917:1245-2045(+)